MAEFTIKIEDVVAFTVLGKQIPLNKLVANVETAEYKPEQFPGLVYRMADPKAAALIFSTGRIICTGAKSIEDAKKAIANVIEKIRKAGIPLPAKYEVHIDNIVAATKIDAKLNLEEISFSIDDAEYDPDKFSGIVYKLKDPNVVLMLFNTGKIICTGAHSTKDIYIALNILKRKLKAAGINAVPASM